MNSNHIHYLVDAQGKCAAVQISAALWERVQKTVKNAESVLTGKGHDPFAVPAPMQAFEDFKSVWDFRYPYEARVECKACGAVTENWEDDPARPFHLTNANFGGLLVFRCRACRATVRKKHFRDHVAYECTPFADGTP